jgi:hypothetical protein
MGFPPLPGLRAEIMDGKEEKEEKEVLLFLPSFLSFLELRISGIYPLSNSRHLRPLRVSVIR